MDVKVFVSPSFKQSFPSDKLKPLIEQFRSYKQTGKSPSHFGRDASFDFPSSVKQAAMSHIHIKDNSSRRWDLKRITYDRTSNTALIYCEGFFNKHCFLLLGFLEGAHETYQNKPQYLLDLAEISEQFRYQF